MAFEEKLLFLPPHIVVISAERSSFGFRWQDQKNNGNVKGGLCVDGEKQSVRIWYCT